MRVFCFCLLLPLAVAVFGQQPSTAAAAPTQPSVQFTLDWPQGIPWTKYSITVQSDGKTHFSGTPHPDDKDTDTDPVEQDFTMWENNRQKIFELAQKLNYFQGNFDAHIKHIAQTGSKTLQYQSPQVHGSSTFNYSQNADVQALAKLFSGIATTFDYQRKLAFEYRYDKLGMDQCLKELEDLQSSHEVEELHVLGPMLRKIAADPNLMNITRQSARHILQKMIDPDPTAHPPDQ
jgi:hypothetical protein